MEKALLEGAAGIFGRGGKTVAAAIDEDTVRDLHARIVRLARERHRFERAGERGRQRFFVPKAQAMDRQARRGMIEPGHPALSVGAQCPLLPISRSSFCYEPQGETATNLGLMLLIDKQFLATPFHGVRQMTWHLQNEAMP